jgi:hypothetical protein
MSITARTLAIALWPGKKPSFHPETGNPHRRCGTEAVEELPKKWPFSAISSSNCVAGCPTQYSYVPAQPLSFPDLAKNCSFLIRKRLKFLFSELKLSVCSVLKGQRLFFPRRRPGLYVPQAQALEDFFDDFLIFYDAYDLHLPRAFGTCEWIYFKYIRRREHLNKVHKDVALKQEEKKSWSKEKYMSYGEVQEVRRALEKEIEEKFEDQEKRNTLLDIVNEWAELRIKTFQNRRSWVRKPEVHDVKTSVKQSHGKIEF